MSRARAGLLALGVLAAPAAAGAEDVQVKAWLGQTAAWVGDRVLYTLEIDCAPHVDVLGDDLLPEKLPLLGLEVVATSRERRESASGAVRYRIQHQLVATDVAVAKPGVGEQGLRYYVRRAGQRAEEAAPAGEVRVPAAALALRSTLPEELRKLELRDGGGARRLPEALGWARPLGLGLVLLSAAPVGLLGLALLRRARARSSGDRARQRHSKSAARGALDALRDAPLADAAARREAFSRLDALLREHLAVAAQLPARALTAGEIAARLREPLPAQDVGALLQECERARYAPLERVPPAERFHSGIAVVERLLQAPR